MKDGAPRAPLWGGVRSTVSTSVVIAGSYVVCALLGLRLAIVADQVTPLYPATGIALAALLLLGWRGLPGIALGAAVVSVSLGRPGPTSVAIIVGQVLAPTITVAMLRAVRFRRDFSRARDVIAFVVVVAGGMLTSASIGVLALRGAGAISPASTLEAWSTWWAGESIGAIAFVPLILLAIARARERHGLSRTQVAELAGVTTLAVGSILLLSDGQFPTRFTILPLLVWAAWRVEQVGASFIASATITTAAYVATLPASAAQGSIATRMFVLQGLAAAATITAIALAAVIADRRIAHAHLKASGAELEERVRARTGELLRALTELERSEARLSEAQRVARIGSWEWDVIEDVATWTDEVYRIYGVPRGTPVTRESYLACVHPDDREMVEAVARRAITDQLPFACDHRVVRPDGRTVWVHSRGRVITNAGGDAVRMLGTTQDIDDRRRIEAASRHLAGNRLRRRQALELNDEVIQGLSVAAYAFHAGKVERAREAVEATLRAARTMVGELLGEVESDLPIQPGDLQREHPASVFRRVG